MKFGQLRTGDVMTFIDRKAVVLAVQRPHPAKPGFILIIWWLFDDSRLSFDMLHPDYELMDGSRVYQDGLMSWHDAIREASRA